MTWTNVTLDSSVRIESQQSAVGSVALFYTLTNSFTVWHNRRHILHQVAWSWKPGWTGD